MENYFAIEPDFTDKFNHLKFKYHHRYLLNINKDYYDILEKFIYDTAVFHLNHHTDSSNNINDYFIEFWIKNTLLINNIHIDCDEHEKEMNNNFVYPTKSIITYLNDHLYPTLFTNIDIENYKYKSFEKENNIKLIFPKKNTQVLFDGSKYHGEINLNEIFETDDKNERLILAINIWKHKPTNIDLYEPYLSTTNDTYNKTTSLLNIAVNYDKHIIHADKQFSETLFDKLLFKNDVSICLLFKDEIQDCLAKKNYYIDILDNSIYNDNQPNLQTESLLKHIENISSDSIQINNRFLQRFVYNNFFSREICEWIIFEADEFGNKHGWNTFRHPNYPTIDIPLEVINPVFKCCAFAFRNLFKQIFKSYCITEKYTANIADMFIVKYEVDSQKSLNIHKDGTHLSFNIMLSDKNDYEGGGTYFDDGITYYLNCGDVLVHSGYINHGSHDITKGARYVLVVFFNIVENLT